VIRGIRVNANDAGSGATINAAASATVPAGQGPITFFIVNTVPVADVAEAFDISIQSGQTILTCTATGVTSIDPDDGQVVFIEIEENFNQAFSDEDDEAGYADYGGAGADGTEIDMEFTITFKDVPEDINIELVDFDDDTLTTTGLIVGDNQDGDGGDMEFTFTVTATASTGGTEKVELTFAATTADPLDSVNGGVTVDVGVSFAAGTVDDGEVPEFVDNEVEDPAFDVTDCRTRLEFSWVPANVAGYDTGVAIANTTEDDAGYDADLDLEGAEPQSGTCRLTGYPAAGGNPVQFTTPTIAAGRTHAMVMSSTAGFSGFAGYVLVLCNFLNAHAFAFITNGLGSATGPTLSQGYEANVVFGGDRTFPLGESLGK
jgi:hypothetical protein